MTLSSKTVGAAILGATLLLATAGSALAYDTIGNGFGSKWGDDPNAGSGADGKVDGVVDAADNDLWKTHFGNVAFVGFGEQPRSLDSWCQSRARCC